jgi:hypothetical protein
MENMGIIADSYWTLLAGKMSTYMKPCLICKENFIQDVDIISDKLSKPLAETYMVLLVPCIVTL